MIKKFLIAMFVSGLSVFNLGHTADSSPHVERTLSMIKPDAVQAHHIGQIIARFEQAGLSVVGAKLVRLSEEQAKEFYAVHKDRPFYSELVKFMTSGPVFVQVLEGPDAIKKNREIMGATNPKNAAPGTVRADFATDTGRNAVHGSDSPEAAKKEIAFFFAADEIVK
jgi:nucleoside-diphosphate kinase